MKKSLLILAATAIVVSCAKTDSLNETNEIPIGFTKVYIENGTKAIAKGAYTTANFETVGNTFGVFGYKTTSTQTNALLFDDQKVEYKSGLSTDLYEATNDWAYSPLKYWDKSATYYYFYAYAPHEGDFTGTAALSSNSATAFSITGFKQATTKSTMIDLMTDLSSKATVSGDAIGTNDVAFTFGHILSNINVKMAVSDALKADNHDNPVTVVSLTLGAIKMDGDYAYNTTATAYKWTLATTSPTTQTFPATQTSGNVFASDALTSVTTGYTNVPDMTDLLFVPQTVDAGYKFVIQYKINNEVFDKEIPLSSFKNTSEQGLATWEPGNKYTYQIVIGPDPILFDFTSVSDWADGGTYTYTIQ